MTGFPSLDKPWLRFYTEEQKNAPLPECGLYEYLWECNKDHLDECALNYFGNKISYRELFQMIDDAAKAFIAIGVKEKEIVPVVTVSTVACVVCLYALNKIGAVADYLNVLSEAKDFQELFSEVDAKVVVTLDLFGEKVSLAAKNSGVKTIVSFGMELEMPVPVKLGYKLKTLGKIQDISSFGNVLSWKDFLSKGKDISDITYSKNPDDMCYLAHTGGTTGKPKAVMLSDRSINAAASQYISGFDAKRGDVFLNLIIPFVIYGTLANIHMPLCYGWETVLIPKFQAEDWAKYIKKYKPVHILAAPSYVIPMLNDEKIKKLDLSMFKTAAVGGDGMTEEKEKELNSLFRSLGSPAVVMPGYGMTEACATSTGRFGGAQKVGSVGIPLPKYNMMIYDSDNKKELTYNEIGEVCLQCPSRMMGYVNNKEEEKQLFRIHEDGSEWQHTGDLGYIDEEGFLFLVGRMKRIILTTKDGVCYKVFPNMSEEILDKHDAVRLSCIVGADDGDNQVLRAYIAVEQENMGKKGQIEKELREICSKELPSYARPHFYEFRQRLPLTAAGKVDYRALEKETI